MAVADGLIPTVALLLALAIYDLIGLVCLKVATVNSRRAFF